jgi:hypothetical protein
MQKELLYEENRIELTFFNSILCKVHKVISTSQTSYGGQAFNPPTAGRLSTFNFPTDQ